MSGASNRLLFVCAVGFVLFAGLFLKTSSADAAFWDDQFILYPGQSKTVAASGQNYNDMHLVMQTDGNLVLYKRTGSTWTWTWTTWTYGNPGARAEMQSDGNLVVYSSSNAVLWSSWTYGNSGATFVLSADGSMSIFNTSSVKLWGPAPSQIYSYSGSQAPWTDPFADGASHTHVTLEGDAAQRANWQWRFDGPGAENVYEPTDMSITKSQQYSPSTDVYWMQEGPNLADALCMSLLANGRCDQFRLRFSSQLAGWPSHMQNNGVCHEFAHSVGFRDGGLNGGSCITGGDNSSLRSWEISKINAKY